LKAIWLDFWDNDLVTIVTSAQHQPVRRPPFKHLHPRLMTKADSGLAFFTLRMVP